MTPLYQSALSLGVRALRRVVDVDEAEALAVARTAHSKLSISDQTK